MLRPEDDDTGLEPAAGPSTTAGRSSSPPFRPEQQPLPTAATRRRERLRALAVYLAGNAVVITLLLLTPDNSISRRRSDSLVTFCFAVGASIGLFLLLQCSDPGYLDKHSAEALAARQQHEEAEHGEGRAVSGLEMVERGQGNGVGLPEDANADDDGHGEQRLLGDRPQRPPRGRRRREGGREDGWCKWCEMYKPVRTHHCRICGLCVARFDHHCSCIGICIGERNHCRFWYFILSQNAACLAAIDVVNAAYNPHFHSLVDWVMANMVYLAISLLLWGMELFAFILLVTHTFFAMANMTSFECAKGPERVWYLRGTRDCDLPFSQGIISNLQTFCCLLDGAWAALVGRRWAPKHWERQPIVRDSADVCEHSWSNRYWTCC